MTQRANRNIRAFMCGTVYSTLTLLSVTALPLSAHAAPAVTGTKGCIMKNGGTAAHWLRPNEPDSVVYDVCNDGSSNNWQSGTFTSADEVNAALSQLEREANSSAGQKIDALKTEQNAKHEQTSQSLTNISNDITNVRNQNTEQGNRLNQLDQTNVTQDDRLTGVEQKNTQQDNQLNNHEQRITQSEADIAGVKDEAVFYNRDENGNKTGGVTLKDGTGNAVRMENVGAGQHGNDAANIHQLSGALDSLGGGAKVNDDGSVNAPTYSVGGVKYHNVGDALAAQNRLSAQQANNNLGYDTNPDGSRSNTVTLTGDGSGTPVLIRNLADGSADTDATNVRQVRQAQRESNAYTDQEVSSLRNSSNERFSALTGEISQTRKEARAGIAGAMAAAGLRFDDRPGKGSIAGGFGGFKNATAFAAGVGYTTQDGRFRLNSGISHSFSDRATGWNAAASWTFN